MNKNPLIKLQTFGQSIWLDFIQKGMIDSGELQSLIRKDGILGVTSNPSIFEKAITGSKDYDDAINREAIQGRSSQEIYELITVLDIQKAADLFHSTFEKTKGEDGYVSLEVSPHLAHDTEGTLKEARVLWKKVSRPNVLIKVPGTAAGLPAIRQLIAEGINVNVTLLFGLDRYAEVIEAYISGLETRHKAGRSLRGVTSVASFFLSRIDTAVDKSLSDESFLRGVAAIASAQVAYQEYLKIFSSERFNKLNEQGAKPQRLLWASTSTKSAIESDVKYVEALIGPHTINTVPMETLRAYRDHGNPASRLEHDASRATQTLEQLRGLGIDLGKVTQKLEDEGVEKFSQAFDKLLSAIESKRVEALSSAANAQPITLFNCGEGVEKRVHQLMNDDVSARVWRKDATLWRGDIGNSLGWLGIAETMEKSRLEIENFAQEIKAAGFENVVLMGMGGSSLAPLVFERTFSSQDGIALVVLDTTDVVTLKKVEESIQIEKTLFIVASKSGTTAEPLAFRDYFYEKVKAIMGAKAGENFVAITDPGTKLEREALAQGFRRIFPGAIDIGGRYSALSYFGLIPAALMGVNIQEVLNRALISSHCSKKSELSYRPPALILGAALGELALHGRDKVTLILEPPMESLGLWLEQLMAESTGKQGKGLIPIANEPIGSVSNYGSDRVFVYLYLKDSLRDSDKGLTKEFVLALKSAGHPVIEIELSDIYDLGREFFQWEFATAIAGSVLGINAFNQPNVQESKDNTDRLLAQGPEKNEKSPVISPDSLDQILKLEKPGDYIAIMAFLPESYDSQLQAIRARLRDRFKLATTLGYGPRFLHSTGQLHKGGPNTGIFIQLTADDPLEIPIPGRSYGFSFFKKAQAQGDLEALQKHGRHVLRIHLGADIQANLSGLEKKVGPTFWFKNAS